MSEEPPRLVNPPEEDAPKSSWYSVPTRAVAREVRVPLFNDPPQPRSRTAVPADSGPLRRFSPLKSWPEVAAYDAKLAQLDRQRSELGERIGRLEQSINDARTADRTAVADWQLAGGTGAHPPSTVPALEAELEQARYDVESFASAEDRILREKVAFVEKHRKRLVSDAAKARSEAVKSLQNAITTVEQAREEATAALQTERWAREFPGEDANPSTLSLGFLKGGRLSKAMPEVRTLTVATSVLEWLRDAAWINSALADATERPLDPMDFSLRFVGGAFFSPSARP
jgi:hypothetical protein